MFYRFSDFDPSFSNPQFTALDELRRRFDRVWEDYTGREETGPFQASSAWPEVHVTDEGESLVFHVDAPGLGEKDFNLSLAADTLTLSGERRTAAPEGYSVQRQERPSAKFSRSWTLPFKADAERTTAALENGVLTVTIAKAAEARPRQIAIRPATTVQATA